VFVLNSTLSEYAHILDSLNGFPESIKNLNLSESQNVRTIVENGIDGFKQSVLCSNINEPLVIMDTLSCYYNSISYDSG